MISVEELEKAILELEQHDTTFATCEKLSWLYTVRDHLKKPIETARTGTQSGNEFVCACSNVPVDALLNTLAEHFDAIKVLYPKEYAALLRKIKELSL